MPLWKMPPKAKIFEALGAIADQRVHLVDSGKAEVVSSSGGKTYIVEWSEDLTSFSSNDNASYWQGYIGYPIIAVLMKIGQLEFSNEAAHALSGIPWKQINQQYKNNYEKTIDDVLTRVEANGVDRTIITTEVERLSKHLEKLALKRLAKRQAPPKGM